MIRRLALAALLALTPCVASAQMAVIAPTAPSGDSSDRIANTAFVQGAVGTPALASGKIFIGSASNVATAQSFSGDGTLSIAGVFALLSVNSNVGSFGSATQCPSFTVNAKGLITAASQATCTPAITNVTGLGAGVAAALGNALNSTGGLVGFSGNIGAASGTSLALGGASIGSNALAVTGASALGATAITSPSGVCFAAGLNGTTNAAFQIDCSASSQASGLWVKGAPTGGTVQIAVIDSGANANLTVDAKGAGAVTIGASTTSGVVLANNVNISTGPFQVGTHTMTFPAAAATLTQTVASGATAMGTGAIASASCATVVTATATGTATTDVLTASFNGDPTAVTGYIPTTAGMLTIIAYPTANTANFKVCNDTSSSITPGAITLNWRVVR